ncbi:hypothetical protein L596_025747 [Steinernema carpocapsae]|uniref:VWFA domain-containing protein n=1 Tax=Steinernema carpocapsae TaxID=34508 RepID=A0A4U5M8Q5_STECR|nr:hypothetical protein L596_025747 [Steinernema carpocapsae]
MIRFLHNFGPAEAYNPYYSQSAQPPPFQYPNGGYPSLPVSVRRPTYREQTAVLRDEPPQPQQRIINNVIRIEVDSNQAPSQSTTHVARPKSGVQKITVTKDFDLNRGGFVSSRQPSEQGAKLVKVKTVVAANASTLHSMDRDQFVNQLNQELEQTIPMVLEKIDRMRKDDPLMQQVEKVLTESISDNLSPTSLDQELTKHVEKELNNNIDKKAQKTSDNDDKAIRKELEKEVEKGASDDSETDELAKELEKAIEEAEEERLAKTSPIPPPPMKHTISTMSTPEITIPPTEVSKETITLVTEASKATPEPSEPEHKTVQVPGSSVVTEEATEEFVPKKTTEESIDYSMQPDMTPAPSEIDYKDDEEKLNKALITGKPISATVIESNDNTDQNLWPKTTVTSAEEDQESRTTETEFPLPKSVSRVQPTSPDRGLLSTKKVTVEFPKTDITTLKTGEEGSTTKSSVPEAEDSGEQTEVTEKAGEGETGIEIEKGEGTVATAVPHNEAPEKAEEPTMTAATASEATEATTEASVSPQTQSTQKEEATTITLIKASEEPTAPEEPFTTQTTQKTLQEPEEATVAPEHTAPEASEAPSTEETPEASTNPLPSESPLVTVSKATTPEATKAPEVHPQTQATLELEATTDAPEEPIVTLATEAATEPAASSNAPETAKEAAEASTTQATQEASEGPGETTLAPAPTVTQAPETSKVPPTEEIPEASTNPFPSESLPEATSQTPQIAKSTPKTNVEVTVEVPVVETTTEAPESGTAFTLEPSEASSGETTVTTELPDLFTKETIEEESTPERVSKLPFDTVTFETSAVPMSTEEESQATSEATQEPEKTSEASETSINSLPTESSPEATSPFPELPKSTPETNVEATVEVPVVATTTEVSEATDAPEVGLESTAEPTEGSSGVTEEIVTTVAAKVPDLLTKDTIGGESLSTPEPVSELPFDTVAFETSTVAPTSIGEAEKSEITSEATQAPEETSEASSQPTPESEEFTDAPNAASTNPEETSTGESEATQESPEASLAPEASTAPTEASEPSEAPEETTTNAEEEPSPSPTNQSTIPIEEVVPKKAVAPEAKSSEEETTVKPTAETPEVVVPSKAVEYTSAETEETTPFREEVTEAETTTATVELASSSITTEKTIEFNVDESTTTPTSTTTPRFITTKPIVQQGVCPVANDVTDKNKADVLFLVDSSSSIPQDQFQRALKLIRDTVQQFKNIGPNGTQVSLVQYNREPFLEFSLRRHNCITNLLDDISDTHYMNGVSNMGNAIEKVMNYGFSKRRGDRPDAPNVLVLVSDGSSDDNVKVPMKLIEKDNTTVLVISTVEAHPDVLRELAGSDLDKMFHLGEALQKPLHVRLAEKIREVSGIPLVSSEAPKIKTTTPVIGLSSTLAVVPSTAEEGNPYDDLSVTDEPEKPVDAGKGQVQAPGQGQQGQGEAKEDQAPGMEPTEAPKEAGEEDKAEEASKETAEATTSGEARTRRSYVGSTTINSTLRSFRGASSCHRSYKTKLWKRRYISAF